MNKKGIALMIVLAAVAILTAVATEFAYQTDITYNLAKNEEERAKSYFLAESAIKLMVMELKLEKQMRSNAASNTSVQNVNADLTGPICQQFPLSTALIRSMFLGETDSQAEGGEGTGSPAAFVSGLQVEAAKEFLNFDGDFEGQCEDESAKFNLNSFFGKDPTTPALSGVNDYDKVKQVLVSYLMRPEYKDLFPKDQAKEASDIARNIADWVDKDDRMNESPGVSTGAESSQYSGRDYSVKNGKFLSLDEVYKVVDVADDWFTPIKDNFTIYGDGKVNVCVASDEVTAALIVQYANSNTALTPVNPNDKEKMANYVSVVKSGCTGVTPDVNQIATLLDQALGVGGGAGAATSGTAATGATTSSGGFAALITSESRYYKLIGTGTVGDTNVRITGVLDAKDSNAANWRFVYWRVE